jgi:S1-C subfamily serine protease
MKHLLLLLALLAGCAHATATPPKRQIDVVGRAFHNTVTLQTRRGQVFCSGVITERVVLTAWHCIEGGHQTFIRTAQGEVFEAAVSSTNEVADLAVLVPADGRRLRRGVPVAGREPRFAHPIWVIGHPLGTYEFSITKGIVSHPHRKAGIFGGDWMQHDAGSVGGNSGGPVLNKQGRIVGITSFGVIQGVYCNQRCPGVYQDTHLSGAVHISHIKQILSGE